MKRENLRRAKEIDEYLHEIDDYFDNEDKFQGQVRLAFRKSDKYTSYPLKDFCQKIGYNPIDAKEYNHLMEITPITMFEKLLRDLRDDFVEELKNLE